MEYIKGKTLEFLEIMPYINSASTYGSGFFPQGKDHDIQALDLIISVDYPNFWHRENYEINSWMYEGSGLSALFNHDKDGSFPKGLGTFFTSYKGRDYKLVVVDKEMLYDNLKTWNHFSLPGRFQKPMTLLIDNSNGVLTSLMKENYNNAVKTSMLISPTIPFEIRELYEKIAMLSYLGDMRTIFHFEDPNKISNIVDGSLEFFEDVYGENDLFYRVGEHIYRKDVSNLEIVDTLPSSLKNYIHEDLSYKEINNSKKIHKRVMSYFRYLDFFDSLEMALRCNQTVGIEKTLETVIGKAKKGMQKVKK